MIENAPIEFSGIRKSFDREPILDNVAMTIRCGKLYLLSGENGSGKTTLLRILSGLLKPDTGKVNFGFSANPIKRCKNKLLGHLMYVHQTPYMFEGSVYRNLAIARSFFRHPSADPDSHAPIDEKTALQWAMLSKYKTSPAKSLSGGQQQRVALARAWIRNTPFILLDEPIANMDTNSTTRTLGLIVKLKQQGAGIIISSHNYQVFSEHIDHHLILENGKLNSAVNLEYGGNVTPINRTGN